MTQNSLLLIAFHILKLMRCIHSFSLLHVILEYTQTYLYSRTHPWRLFTLFCACLFSQFYFSHCQSFLFDRTVLAHCCLRGKRVKISFRLYHTRRAHSIDGVSLITVKCSEPTTTTRPTIWIRHRHSFKWNTPRISTSNSYISLNFSFSIIPKSIYVHHGIFKQRLIDHFHPSASIQFSHALEIFAMNASLASSFYRGGEYQKKMQRSKQIIVLYKHTQYNVCYCKVQDLGTVVEKYVTILLFHFSRWKRKSKEKHNFSSVRMHMRTNIFLSVI